MPIHRVQTPDGQTVEVEAPADATPDQVIAFAQQNYKAQPQAAPEQTSALQAGFIGAGRSLDRLAAGLRSATPEALRNAIDKANATFGFGEPPSIDPATQDAATKAYAQVEKQHPVASFIGEAAPTLATANPLAMAGIGALEYGTPAERMVRGSAGYLGGKVGQGIARLFGPASMAATPQGKLASEFFNDTMSNPWGIPTTVGMGGNKTAQLAESVIANMPFVNRPVNAARDAAYQGFNKAVSNTYGDTASQITQEGLGAARQRIGSNIGKIAERNTFVADPTFAQDFASLTQKANSDLVGDGLAKFNKWTNNVMSKLGQDGTMSGTQYRILRGDIREAAKNTVDGDTRKALGALAETVESAMDRSIKPGDAAAWKTLNRQYFNVNQVADAAKNTPGSLSPTQLLQAVNRSQRGAKFGAGNDLAELAQWAKPTLSDQIPNSGTAQRALMQRILTNPLLGAAELTGAGYGLSYTDNPYGYGALGLMAPYIVGRSLSGKPASKLTRDLLTRGGGLLGLELTQ